ncbi:MAG TPA: T9SS type A sorting domain-containing protein, partial [Bacteroidia bacterium]|nr:T9SS type A sorting domain-containing protein [Bacteroidia bacterium]
QSLTATGASTPLSGDENTLLVAEVTIHNGAANTLDVLAERTVNNLAPGHTSYFCWFITCYPVNVSLATDPASILSDSNEYSFRGYLNPNGNFGQSTVCYKFFDMNNVTDSVFVCFDYDIVTGIQVAGASATNPLSVASPNPANNLTSINYNSTNVNSRIVVYNLLGVAVKEVKLNSKQGALILATSDLNQGVYFYSLISGEKIMATKKLVVAHK